MISCQALQSVADVIAARRKLYLTKSGFVSPGQIHHVAGGQLNKKFTQAVRVVALCTP